MMNGADRPLGTMPDFIRQVPIDKAMHPDTLLAYEMNGQPIPPAARLSAARDRSRVGRRLLGQVADEPARDRSRVRQLLGRHRLSLSHQTRRARRRGRSEGHGAADRPRRQVADHQAARRRDASRRARSTWPDSRGRAKPDIARVDVSTDHGASWQAGATGWRAAQVRVAPLRVSHSTRARPESYLILSRATDSNGRTQPMTPPWNPSGYLWNAPDSVRVEVKA